MVAGAFLGAGVQIHGRVLQRGGEGGGGEQVVDAQAEAALEHRAAIVEPGVKRAFGADLAQAVGQAQTEQGLEPAAFLVGAEDFAAPFFRVVAVGVGGGDVEVAEQNQLFMTGDFVAHQFGERGKPLFFILELGAVGGFAVDAVDIDDAHAANGGGDDAPLRVVGQRGQAGAHVVQRVTADDGDAVVGFLAAPRAVPTHHFEGGSGEFVLVEFELLQGEDVGLVFGEPVLHLRQAHVEGIDVPGGDFHGLRGGFLSAEKGHCGAGASAGAAGSESAFGLRLRHMPLNTSRMVCASGAARRYSRMRW